MLVEEKEILVEENEILVEENDLLVEENEILVEENDLLGEENDLLVEENEILVEENEILVEENVPPSGWIIQFCEKLNVKWIIYLVRPSLPYNILLFSLPQDKRKAYSPHKT